jgi:hypothetical protein
VYGSVGESGQSSSATIWKIHVSYTRLRLSQCLRSSGCTSTVGPRPELLCGDHHSRQASPLARSLSDFPSYRSRWTFQRRASRRSDLLP